MKKFTENETNPIQQQRKNQPHHLQLNKSTQDLEYEDYSNEYYNMDNTVSFDSFDGLNEEISFQVSSPLCANCQKLYSCLRDPSTLSWLACLVCTVLSIMAFFFFCVICVKIIFRFH